MITVLALAFSVVLLLNGSHGENSDADKCSDGCAVSETSIEQLQVYYREKVKEKILRQLRLDEPPNITLALLPRLPVSVSHRHRRSPTGPRRHPDRTDVSEPRSKQQILFFGEAETKTCKKSSCFRFKIRKIIPQEKISKAELWIFKPNYSTTRQKTRIVIYDLVAKARKMSRVVVISRRIPRHRGWLTYDVKHVLRRWLNRSDQSHMIEIVCEFGSQRYASKQSNTPFILVEHRKVRRREKRNVVLRCTTDTQQCCLDDLTIHFDQIGWSNFVLYPSSIKVNYCRGVCDLSRGMDGIGHVATIQTLRRHSTNQTLISMIEPCCTPTRYSSVNLYVRTSDFDTERQKIDEMIAENCGCF